MTARRFAWGFCGLTVGLLAAWLFIAAQARTLGDEWVYYAIVPIAVGSYATVGALITSRHPENRIGLILASVAFTLAISLTAGDYTTLAAHREDALPFARWVAWLGRVSFALWLAPLPLLFLLYPNGRVLSPRWRPVLWVLLAALAVNLTLFAVTPGRIEPGFSEAASGVMNPVGLPLAWLVPIQRATELAGLVAFVCAGLAAISLVFRFRRSPAEERQQIRWLGYVGAVLVAVPIIALLITLVRSLFGVVVTEENDVVGTAAWIAFFSVLLFGVPAACAIAILKYHLYDLDLVVKKTVQYGLLVVGFTAAVGLVVVIVPILFVGVGTDVGFVPVLVGGVVVAVGFNLVRSRARRWANRIVYGKRSTPYEVLSAFAERVGETYSTEDVLPRMAQLLGEATGATVARVWLRVGQELRADASWPPDAPAAENVAMPADALPPFGNDAAFDVRHQGELLGALTITEALDDPMNATKTKLANDMASQAGLVLRNVRLIEDLRESRRRIVATQDVRAKKLERDIHDGAQQQLVALQVKQRLADSMIDRDPARAHEMLTELQSDTASALEDLRDLARGIYPPLLADKGLSAALESQARKSPVPVRVEADEIGRFPQETEAAVYFSALEALQNIAKYAEASEATVRLAQVNGTLTFEVADDGRGFDPEAAERGTGLQGIADRIAALGGEFEVRSAPGDGTTVMGRVPVHEAAR